MVFSQQLLPQLMLLIDRPTGPILQGPLRVYFSPDNLQWFTCPLAKEGRPQNRMTREHIAPRLPECIHVYVTDQPTMPLIDHFVWVARSTC